MNGQSIQIWAGTTCYSRCTFSQPTFATNPPTPPQVNWVPGSVTVSWFPNTDPSDVTTWTYGATGTEHITKIGDEGNYAYLVAIQTKTLPATAKVVGTWTATTTNDEAVGRAVVPFTAVLRVPLRT